MNQFEPYLAELGRIVSLEQIPSIAAQAAELSSRATGPAAGALVCAHAILMELWRVEEGQEVSPEQWAADLRVIGMLRHLIDSPTQVSLAGLGRAWTSRFSG